MNCTRFLCSLSAITLLAVGCTEENTACTVAPLSVALFHDKLDFTGLWEHTATVVEAPAEAGIEPGTTSTPRPVAWELGEELLLARDASGELVVVYAIESHVSAGYASGGGICVASVSNDEQPWHERRFVRVDWTQDLITSAALPLDPMVGVEPVSPNLEDLEERPDDDVLDLRWDGEVNAPPERFTIRNHYWVTPDCADCTGVPVVIDHLFVRSGSAG